jgi:hypothetical protein
VIVLGPVHVGRRGRVLLFFGCLDLVYAVSFAVPDSEARSGSFFTWLSHIAPSWAWAISWAVVGVLCLIYAFRRRDQVGYAAATCLKIFWGLVCLGGWLFGGVSRGYVSAAIFLGLAYLMARVFAPWPEPGDLKGPTWTPPSS